MCYDVNKLHGPEDLARIALEKGFTISDSPGLGNCMFYAMVEQLRSAKGVQCHTIN